MDAEKNDMKIIPLSMWLCIKDGVNTLIDSKVADGVKRDIGLLLLRNITLLEKQTYSKSVIDNDDDDCAGLKKDLNELRQHVLDVVDKIFAIAQKTIGSDEQAGIYWERIVKLEEKITIMDNVNYNFRKILKLENDFLRDLLQIDRETIKGLHKKMVLLQSKSDPPICESNSTPETVIEQRLKSNNQDTAVQPVPEGSIKHVPSSAQYSETDISNLLMECIIDLISRGLTKEEILKLFRCIRSYCET